VRKRATRKPASPGPARRIASEALGEAQSFEGALRTSSWRFSVPMLICFKFVWLFGDRWCGGSGRPPGTAQTAPKSSISQKQTHRTQIEKWCLTPPSRSALVRGPIVGTDPRLRLSRPSDRLQICRQSTWLWAKRKHPRCQGSSAKFWVPEGSLAENVRAGFRPIFGQTWPPNPGGSRPGIYCSTSAVLWFR
jgi:hypothetical protein